MTDREKLIKTAYSMIGYTESQIKQIWYKQVGRTDWDGAFCSEFISDCIVLAGLRDKMIISNYSADMARKYAANDQMTTDPEPGDLVFFAYSGEIDHVGLLAAAGSKYYTVIEANIGSDTSSKSVMARYYGIDNRNIAAFAAPLERDDIMKKLDRLSYGAEGNQVRNLQQLLNLYITRYEPLKVDGKYGKNTQERVRLYQTIRMDQNSEYITIIDGICGNETWSDLLLA